MFLRSVHTILRTTKPGKAGNRAKGIKPVSPVTEEIPPGKLFECSEEDGAFFLKMRAAVIPSDEKYIPQSVVSVSETKQEPTNESSLSEEKSESSAGDSDTPEEAPVLDEKDSDAAEGADVDLLG